MASYLDEWRAKNPAAARAAVEKAALGRTAAAARRREIAARHREVGDKFLRPFPADENQAGMARWFMEIWLGMAAEAVRPQLRDRFLHGAFMAMLKTTDESLNEKAIQAEYKRFRDQTDKQMKQAEPAKRVEPEVIE